MGRRRLLEELEPILLIAIGGFAGVNLRHFADLFVSQSLFATFLVNVAGSFALAVLVYDSLSEPIVAARSRLVFGTGFLSSFTTYSTFVLGATQASLTGAAIYVGASYLCGFLAVVLGRAFVRGGGA
ncbi:fluoride efflux transporter FluC [Haloferacaceae archaeon DSL9]